MQENIIGFNVTTINEEELLKMVFNDLNTNLKNVIVNINPLIILDNYKNPEMINLFNNEKYQIPDGEGIVLASKLRHGNIKERITGIDFMKSICEEATKQNKSIYLYGAKPGIAEKAKKELSRIYKTIKICGCTNGYVDEKQALKEINKAKPDILFVAMGSPKQEQFIFNNKAKITANLIMPVGGSFDVISKTLKRAPILFINLKLEWLYRMIKEPSRIKRNARLVKFLFMAIIKKK